MTPQALQARGTPGPGTPPPSGPNILVVKKGDPDAIQTVREAVAAALASPTGGAGDTFWVQGEYEESEIPTLPPNVSVLGGSIEKITEIGPCSPTPGRTQCLRRIIHWHFTPGPCESVVIDGGDAPIFACSTPGATFSGLTLKSVSTASSGGGILASGAGTVTVTDCCFTDLHARDGGAIYSAVTTLSLTSCRFIACSASRDGGAVNQRFNALTCSGCIFRDNRAGGASQGGAVHAERAEVTISGTTFTNN